MPLVYTLPLNPCDPEYSRQAQAQTNYCASKLLSPPRQTFHITPTPFPQEVSVGLLMLVLQQLSTCRVTGWVPVKVTAVGSLHKRIAPRFTLLPKPLQLHWGRYTVKVAFEHLQYCNFLWDVGELDIFEKKKRQIEALTESKVCWHGPTSLFIREVYLCFFFFFLAEGN